MLRERKQAIAVHEIRMSEQLFPDASESEVLLDALSRVDDHETRQLIVEHYYPKPEAVEARLFWAMLFAGIAIVVLAFKAGLDMGAHL